MSWWNPKTWRKKKETPPPTPPSGGGGYSGPVQEGTDEKTFRETGRSVPISSGGGYSGPVQEGTDEKTFRETGRSVPSGGLVAPPTTTTTTTTSNGRLKPPTTTTTKTTASYYTAFDPKQSEFGYMNQPKQNIFKQTYNWMGKSSRALLNERTGDDLTSKSGIFVGSGIRNINVRTIPTGTRIDEGSGIRTTLSGQEYLDSQSILAGGRGTPTVFLEQNIVKDYSNKAQAELDKETNIIQNRINSGSISVSEGQTQLANKQIELTEKTNKEISKQLESDLTISRSRNLDKEHKLFSKQADISGGVRLGAELGGLALAPATGGLSALPVLAFGGAEFFSSVSKPTTSQKFLTASSGLLSVGLGGGAVKSGIKGTLLRGEIADIERGLSLQEFSFKGVSAETDRVSFESIKGIKLFGGITQEASITGKTVKIGENIFVSSGKGSLASRGELETLKLFGEPSKFISVSNFKTSAGGLVAQTGKNKVFGLGLGASESKLSTSFFFDNLKNTERFGRGIGKQITKNIRVGGDANIKPFYFTSNKIPQSIILDDSTYFVKSKSLDKVFVDTSKKSIDFKFDKGSKGIIKVFKMDKPPSKTFDIGGSGVGSVSKFKGTTQLPSITTTTNLDSISKGLSNTLKQSSKQEFNLISDVGSRRAFTGSAGLKFDTTSKTSTTTRITPTTTQITSQSLLPKVDTKVKSIFSGASIFKTNLKDLTSEKVGVAQTSIPKLKLKTAQTTKQSFRGLTPSLTKTTYPFQTPRGLGIPKIFPIPFFPKGSFGNARGGRRMPSAKTRGEYPSFSAIFFRWRGKKAKPTTKLGFTGFEQRLVSPEYKFLIPSKKKTKKKKK